MTEYTDQECDTIRTAAFGAMTLVAAADPGFFAMFKESMAGAKALAAAPQPLQGMLKSGGMPTAAKDKASVLAALQQSKQILSAKSPEDLAAFQNVIATACNEVASAANGVAETEVAAINEVRSAIGVA
ncbi:hypothetical protein Rhe02_88590 [Rhizocola hellebori]|uniref:Uncharacterized protein n=1 Tax=Rhizocola hellebori TaxID=1392758 RepID=A0A8J3QJH5_9ACTN|nr:hypothetical protein [Rhizocola hellebori]GIH10792.1 hypothetical protein Rhe02_88590 [Rhizocola hellebori]